MEAIYNSKLYKGSKRKQRIEAALSNPVNSELVVQLKSALNVPEEEVAPKKPNLSPEAQLDAELREEALRHEQDAPRFSRKPSAPHRGSPARPMPTSEEVDNLSPAAQLDDAQIDEAGVVDPAVDAPDGIDDTTPDAPEGDAADPAAEEPAEEVESASQVSAPEVDWDSECIDLRSILNNNSATQGANHVVIKGDELWLYYNDDVNLNKIMTEVVDTVRVKLGNRVQFNRLARMDNAVVFEIE